MKTKHIWDKKRLIKAIIGFVVCMVSIQGYNHLKLFRPENRYYIQLFGVFIAVSAVYCILNLRKAIPKTVRESVFKGLRWVFKKVSGGFNKVAKQLRKLLGIPEPVKKVKGRDERSFVFDIEDEDLNRRYMSRTNTLRWRDLESNADKVRFLYIKFIVRMKRRGYKYSSISTPDELGKLWKLKEEEGSFMFPLYTVARYSGGRAPVSDEDVERSAKVAKYKS